MSRALANRVDQPLYTFAEAARYLHIPTSTVRAWSLGREYATSEGKRMFEPVIHVAPAAAAKPRLSFAHLIELYVIRSLREQHSVKLGDIRTAIEYAERKLNIPRLLIHPKLQTIGGDLLIDYYGELISLNRSGQIALRAILKDALKRVNWEDEIPARLFLYVPQREEKKSVFVDPRIRYGKPVVAGVETKVITARIDAGETLEDLARDYAIPLDAITDALVFEASLARAA